MTYTFRPSLEEQFTKAPTIALAGPTGSGKTESAMRLARGYCGEGVRFAVVDTEEKRALYKRARHQPWDWLDFQPPFSPQRYIDILEAAKHYPAVVLDSGSHEWFGDGGCSDMHDQALQRMSKGDERAMERLSAPAWRDAKQEHKKFMARLIRYPTLLIVCLRAEPKLKFLKEKFTRDNGSTGEKTVIVDAGYQPICEKMFMYEMLVGAMMHSDNAGVPVHIKQLEPELESVFLSGKQIDEATGARLRAWADGRTSPKAVDTQTPGSASAGSSAQQREAASTASSAATGDGPVFITENETLALIARCDENGIDVARLKKAANVTDLAKIESKDLARAQNWISAAIAAKAQAA